MLGFIVRHIAMVSTMWLFLEKPLRWGKDLSYGGCAVSFHYYLSNTVNNATNFYDKHPKIPFISFG